MAQSSDKLNNEPGDYVTIPRAFFERLSREADAFRMMRGFVEIFEARGTAPISAWSASGQGTALTAPQQDLAQLQQTATPSSIPVEPSAHDTVACPPNTASNGPTAGPYLAIYIPSIPIGTTLQQLVAVIKGGAIISLHTVNIKREGKTSTRGYLTMKSGAKQFIDWSRLNPIYLHGKKIIFIWSNDKPNTKPAVEHAVAAGATRNIIIHGLGAKAITSDMLQEDLANLAWHSSSIISNTIKEGDAYISTNSVYAAMRLREALLGHHNYIGCSASYYPDECDRPVNSKPDVLPIPKAITNNVPLSDVDTNIEKLKRTSNDAAWKAIREPPSSSSGTDSDQILGPPAAESCTAEIDEYQAECSSQDETRGEGVRLAYSSC